MAHLRFKGSVRSILGPATNRHVPHATRAQKLGHFHSTQPHQQSFGHRLWRLQSKDMDILIAPFFLSSSSGRHLSLHLPFLVLSFFLSLSLSKTIPVWCTHIHFPFCPCFFGRDRLRAKKYFVHFTTHDPCGQRAPRLPCVPIPLRTAVQRGRKWSETAGVVSKRIPRSHLHRPRYIYVMLLSPPPDYRLPFFYNILSFPGVVAFISRPYLFVLFICLFGSLSNL